MLGHSDRITDLWLPSSIDLCLQDVPCVKRARVNGWPHNLPNFRSPESSWIKPAMISRQSKSKIEFVQVVTAVLEVNRRWKTLNPLVRF
jgi:hypothetical protein